MTIGTVFTSVLLARSMPQANKTYLATFLMPIPCPEELPGVAVQGGKHAAEERGAARGRRRRGGSMAGRTHDPLDPVRPVGPGRCRRARARPRPAHRRGAAAR